MKAHYKTRDGRMQFEVEGQTVADIFRLVGGIQDAFESDSQCGHCGCTALRYQVRTVDSYQFYELVCTDCAARLSLGQHKKGGTLFPKRRDEHGNLMGNRGWEKYEPEPARTVVSEPPRSVPDVPGMRSKPKASAARPSQQLPLGGR